MKQVNIHAANDVRIDDVPTPEAGAGDVLLRVAACGICGSDLGYIKLGGVAGPTGKPMPLGHELSGVIESVGEGIEHLAPGDRVVVNPLTANQMGNGGSEGAFAPLLLVRNAAAPGCVTRIPDDLPLEMAALAEPLSVGAQAVARCSPSPQDKVVIFGAGPIGLAALAALRHRGVEDVVVVDLSEARLGIAREMKARATLDPAKEDVWARIRELHGTESMLGMSLAGSDVYIEASGASVLIGQVIENAKSDVRLSVVALHRAPIEVNFLLVMLKSLNIIGSMAYPDDWTEALEILGSADLSPMVTHRFPLERFHDALAVAQDPSAGAKVLIVNESS